MTAPRPGGTVTCIIYPKHGRVGRTVTGTQVRASLSRFGRVKDGGGARAALPVRVCALPDTDPVTMWCTGSQVGPCKSDARPVRRAQETQAAHRRRDQTTRVARTTTAPQNFHVRSTGLDSESSVYPAMVVLRSCFHLPPVLLRQPRVPAEPALTPDGPL